MRWFNPPAAPSHSRRLQRLPAKPHPRRVLLESLEPRLVLANSLHASTGSWHEYDTISGDHTVATTPAVLSVSRLTDGANYADSVIVYYTVSGTATQGVDHTLQNGSATIPAWQQFAPAVEFKIRNDGDEEPDETIVITITGYTIASGVPKTYEHDNPDSTGYIADDDAPLPAEETMPGCPTCSKASGTGKVGEPWREGNWKAGVTNSGGAPGWSAHPVRYFDGAVFVTSTDLSSEAGGIPWGVTREWTNLQGYSGSSSFGVGTVVTEQPFLVEADSDTVAVITNGHSAFYFDEDEEDEGVYDARHFLQHNLEHDGDEFILTDTGGAQLRFYDFSSGPNHQQGRLKTYTATGENFVTLHYDTATGLVSDAERSSTVGGVTVTEQLAYTYATSGDNISLVASVTLQRRVGTSGAFTPLRKAKYTYYDTGDAHGNAGDIETVTINEVRIIEEQPVDFVIDTTYYRYYTAASSTGYKHGLKYVFYPQSFARLVAAEGTVLDDIDDGDADNFADHYFEYGAGQRATKEIAQGAGCSTCSGGLGSFQYEYDDRRDDTGYQDGYNSWAMKTTELLPDGTPTNLDDNDRNIVFTNYLGQVMLEVFNDPDTDGSGPDTDKKWSTYYKYDTAGRVVWKAEPSAVSGYGEQYADLLHYQSGGFEYLRNEAGLITEIIYSTETTTTMGGSPGTVAGYPEFVYVSQGEVGDAYLQSYTAYQAYAVGDHTIYPIAQVWDTPNSGQSWRVAYQYPTFRSETFQVEALTTQTADGSNIFTHYDQFGRPTWMKDGGGFIHYTEYDHATGAVAKTIVDVNTTLTSTFTHKPDFWTTPSGGGLHLTTTYELDALGRPTKVTENANAAIAENRNATYIRYNDVAHEIRVYPGWNSTTDAPTGPTIVLREDRATAQDSYLEVLTMSAAPNLEEGTDLPTGEEDVSSVQSLTRTFYNDAGQADMVRDYFVLPTYSASVSLGTVNVNYYETEIRYDSRGRENSVQRGDGTIFRTVYDGLGRPLSEWVGNSDTGWSNATGASGMTKVKEYKFDENSTTTEADDIGNSHLTSVIDALGRQTKLAYDFRGWVVTTTLPDLDTNPNNTNPLVYQTTHDNFGRVKTQTDPLGNVASYEYVINPSPNQLIVTTTLPDPDGPSNPLTSPVTIQTFNNRGLLEKLRDPELNETIWTYDGAGRVKTETNALTKSRTYTYDAADRLTERLDRLGRKIVYEYDAAGRNTFEKWYAPTTNQLLRTISFAYDDAGRLSQVSDPAGAYKYTYDALGRVTNETQDITGLLTDALVVSAPDIQYASDYNGASQLTELRATIGSTPDFKNAYAYDTLARVKSTVQSAVGGLGANAVAPKRADLAYDAAGQFTQITRRAGTLATDEFVINTFYKYDLAGRLTDLIHSMDSTAPAGGGSWGTVPKAGYSFGYDVASQISSINSYLDASATYGYDFTGQLKSANHSSQSDETYSYDENGNRTMSGYQTGTNNLLQSDGTYTYGYDADGNRISRTTITTGEVTTYEYDHRNRLVKVASAYGGQGTAWGWGLTSGGDSLSTATYTGEGSAWGWGESEVELYSEEICLTGEFITYDLIYRSAACAVLEGQTIVASTWIDDPSSADHDGHSYQIYTENGSATASQDYYPCDESSPDPGQPARPPCGSGPSRIAFPKGGKRSTYTSMLAALPPTAPSIRSSSCPSLKPGRK